ncbi:hypothetical protein BGZ65_000846 [Modicella reniformis]|uniref:Uncharacterized protein n=1 Tax=Modicella reniformis TaxID=1440133 RepID=A0A9P6MBP7_9FUNG|nr:hypothetical protein BGZ65_000846 [Modicella reniformis]
MPTDTPADTVVGSTLSSTPAGTGFSTPTLHTDSSNDTRPLTQILALYHKATSTFLLRQLASAYTTSLEALELLSRTNREYGLDHSENLSTRRSFFILKQKLWILHATIFGAMLSDRAAVAAVATVDNHHHNHTGNNRGIVNGIRKRISGSSKDSPEKLVKDIWRHLVEDYGGLEGDVDGQVMVPITLLCINQKLYQLARQIVETYLATIPEDMLIHLETAAGVSLSHGVHGQKDPLMTNYERLVELYLIHTYGKILDKLHQKSLRPKKTVPTKHLQQQNPDYQHSGSKSLSHSTSTSTVSTSAPSPTLSSASTMETFSGSNPLDTMSTHDANTSLPSGGAGFDAATTSIATSKKSSILPATSSSDARTKLAISKKDPAGASSLTTLRSRVLLVLQHYVALVQSASSQMGSNQLMIVVGLVVFLAAVSRNRARASNYMKAGMAKVMQTVRMGTTVTSI